MAGVYPVVRYLIVCGDILLDSTNRKRVTLVDIISTIRSLDDPPYPVEHAELCVFVQLTECRGSGRISVDVLQDESGDVVFRSRAWRAVFRNNPLDVVGIPIRLRRCKFPATGLYWVRLWYNTEVIAQQPLLLR